MKKLTYGLLLLVIGLLLGSQITNISKYLKVLLTSAKNSGEIIQNVKLPITQVENESGLDNDIAGSIVYAKKMLLNKYGVNNLSKDRSPQNIAKLLNYITFNHCRNAVPHTGQRDINELFDVCRTACGGYAYVLRGLLAAHGIRTRYANLYNLPQQGNHTMVEAKIADGRWALFDPTFGTFFTDDGTLNGNVLSLAQLRFTLTTDSIEKHAFTASKGNNNVSWELKELYKKSAFKFDYMDINNYLIAEAGAPAGLNLTVPMVLKMDISKGRAVAGTMDAKTIQEGQSAFLKWTNATLNNDNPTDDVSYLFNVVGDHVPHYKSLNMIRLVGLNKGFVYQLNLAGVSKSEAQIQIVDVGHDLRLSDVIPQKIDSGNFSIKRKFRALANSGELVITLNSSNKSVSLFGVSVIQIK